MDSTGSPQVALGLLLFFFLAAAPLAHASQESGSIDGTLKYAFSNVGGWVNFAPAQSRVTVTDAGLTGYAWSANDGWINLAPTQGGVKNNGNGTLSGFAWDQAAGWVNFTGVTIDSSGRFHGQAVGGTVNGASYAINFDCSTCNVTTDWRPAASRPSSSSSGGGCAPGFVWNPATISCMPVVAGPYSPVITPPPPSSSSTASTASPLSPAASGVSGKNPPITIPSTSGTAVSGQGFVSNPSLTSTTTTFNTVSTSSAIHTATTAKTKVATSTTPATKQSFWNPLTYSVLGILLLIILFVVGRFFL